MSCIARHMIQSCFRLIIILSYTCIDHVCPTALVAVVLLYTLFLLAIVPYEYLLGSGDVLIVNLYVRTLTHPFTSHLVYVWLLVVLGS